MTSVNLSAWGEQPPVWVTLLAAEVEGSTISQTAKTLDMNRTAVSLVLRNSYPANTHHLEVQVLEKLNHRLAQLDCSAQGVCVTQTECQAFRDRKFPAHNPFALASWRACQLCPHNPKNAQRAEVLHG